MFNTEEEIRKVVDPVIDIWKRENNKIFKAPKDSSQPTYYEGYNEFRKWREDISIHTVKGVKPVAMLSVKAPSQSEEELTFVLAMYKQITLPVSMEFLNTIGRGMHPSNWSIQYQPEPNKNVEGKLTLQHYLEEGMEQTPLKMSYDAWWRSVLPSIKINDSMGVVGFKPAKPEKVVQDASGNNVIAGDSLPETIPYYYSTDQVLNDVDEDYFFLDTRERSEVEYQGKKQKVGFVFEIYDENKIHRIEQTGKYVDFKYVVSTYYDHGLGWVQATRLKGMPTYMEGKIIWQSPFNLVTDILDEAILDNTNLRSIKASSTYPQKVMMGRPCRNEKNYGDRIVKCEDGYMLKSDATGYDKCDRCKGSGQDMVTGPLRTILVPEKNAMDSTTPMKPTDALDWKQPSTESAEFLRKEVVQSLSHGKEILHLKTTNAVVKGAEDFTATGMAIDDKAKQAFLSQPVDQIFDIGEFGIKCISGQRYGKEFKLPSVQRPVTYDFNTESDYLANIAQAQNSGAPPAIIQSYLQKYLRAVYYDDTRAAKIYDLIIATDRILPLSQTDIQGKVARQLIYPWEVILHDSAKTIIDSMIMEDPGFFEKTVKELIPLLVDKAKALVPVPAASAKALTPESILANANAAPVNIN